jgi:hypothetical protein
MRNRCSIERRGRMGDIDVKRLTEEELDHLLVEMVMKMSPEQLEKVAEMICEAAVEAPETKEAS